MNFCEAQESVCSGCLYFFPSVVIFLCMNLQRNKPHSKQKNTVLNLDAVLNVKQEL